MYYGFVMPGDTTNKRNAAQIETDRAEIARRYLRGETQAAIGTVLHMSQQMVSYDLAAIKKQWQASAIHDLSAAKAKELAKIDHLEVTYWLAWEESRLDKEITVEKQSGGEPLAGEGGKPPETKKETTLRREGQAGSPAFLAGVQWCIERRCKILGIDAPTKSEVTGLNGGPVTVQVLRGVSMDDL